MALIHPTAFVERGAELEEDVVVGPYCSIGRNVKIGSGTRVGQGTVIDGDTTIGRDCKVFNYAVIGVEPQDLKYRGEPSKVIIGNNVKIREFVTIHRGTEGGGMVTKVGNNVLLMAYSHVAHDCKVGDNAILANAVTLAGHVEIEEFAIVGGLTGIHQFVRIGKHAMVGGASAVDRDVPPFCVAKGNRAKLEGINIIGLRRRNFGKEKIKVLTAVFEAIFRSDEPISVSVKRVEEEFGKIREVKELVDFIRSSRRGICPS